MSEERLQYLIFEGKERPAKSTLYNSTANKAQELDQNEDVMLSSEEETLVAYIFERANINKSQYRIAPLKRRIPACLRSLKVNSVSKAIEVISKGVSQDYLAALNSLLIGTTELYRDVSVFNDLRIKILPELVSRRESIRVLSLACSEGPEVYTMAALLDELNVLQKCELVGVDIRPSAIECAKNAVYSKRAVSSMPEDLTMKYITQQGMSYVISPQLKANILWELGDVFNSKRFKESWDIVLCRNLAIYLHTSVADNLWLKIFSCLKDGGILVTGKAERPQGYQKLSASVFKKNKDY